MDENRERLTTGQWALSSVAAVLMLCLAALAFTGMFTAVRAEMVPFFGWLAWIVPIGVDLGIVILVLTGILLEWLAMPMPALRFVAAFFMGATMWLNALAAHGSPAGIVGHLSLPVLFIASVEAVRHAVRRRSGLAAGTVREGIPLARWALAPFSSWQVNRRMVLWREHSYERAIEREVLRRRTVAVLKARHGADWRDRADSAVAWQLRHGIDVEGAARAVEASARPDPGTPPPARQKRATGSAAAGDSSRAKVEKVMARYPGATVAEIARKSGVSERTVKRVRSEVSESPAARLHAVSE